MLAKLRLNWGKNDLPKGPGDLVVPTFPLESPDPSSRFPQEVKQPQHSQSRRADSPWIYAAVFQILNILTLCLNLAIQLVSTFIISNYSPSHSGKGVERMEKILRQWEHWNGQQPLWDSSSNSQASAPRLPTVSVDGFPNVSIPMFIIDPSAATFMSVIMIYSSAVLFCCTIGKAQHRDHFLVFGGLLGATFGTLAAWVNSNLELLKDYIPISITAALTLSLVWHALLPLVLRQNKLHTLA